MKKRLFVGVQLPQEYMEVLADYIGPHKENYPWLTWTPMHNLHITVLFIGEVELNQVSVIQ
jgi:2'-5' RNA ligase